jgi:hypothetical protein
LNEQGKHIINDELLELLKKEALLLDEVLKLSEKQQKALVDFDIKKVERITYLIEQASKELNHATRQRVNFVADALHLDPYDTKSLKLSEYEEIFELNGKAEEIKKLFREKTKAMYSMNAVNRMLANRASHSIKDMLAIMMNGNRKVCNVRI